MRVEIKNAIITKATLTTEERGFLDARITLDYGGSCQGFGGYTLYLPKSWKHHGGPNFAGHFIFRVMEIAGVTEWSNLPGKTVRANLKDGLVRGLGHIVKDDWFHPGEDFNSMKAEGEAS